MEGGKISVHFPQYHFTAEITDNKLIMVRKPIDFVFTSTQKGVEILFSEFRLQMLDIIH